MRIYTKAGDLAFTAFKFPDGQPHFKLDTYEREFNDVTIETAIKSCDDLMLVTMAASVLRANGYPLVNLDIRYLMGARMDREIDSFQPFTLQLVARQINACGFNRVRVLDAHSEVTWRLLRNCTNVLPYDAVRQVMTTTIYPVVACPDKGAMDRVSELCGGFSLQGHKMRDMQTGKLSGFGVDFMGIDSIQGSNVLIVDDIGDGCGTFSGLAEALKKRGAKRVYLYVTHGVFSKGLPIPHVDQVYTTDSYDISSDMHKHATVIPVSMKEMK